MLVLKIVDEIRSGMFSYAFTKQFPDVSELGHKVVKRLKVHSFYNSDYSHMHWFD